MSSKYLLYIQESISRSGIYYLNKEIPVWSDDPLPEYINLRAVLDKIETMLPNDYFKYVDAMKIGTFPEMIDRELNAMYNDGVLYVSNFQSSEEDMYDDIIHEIAHAVEDNNRDLIYGDERLMVEFLGKRKRLYSILKSQGYDVTLKEFLNVSYDEDFDMFLYQDIGYTKLNNLVMGLFPGAYSVTSLNEYFAVGFERYYMREGKNLSKMCPVLIKKIDLLDEIANEYE
jgi:hypothetical protein|tara:strand:- start:59 stop:745 length:687 start_codon:yes stop_codon:yes gene_type:complete